MVTHTHIFFPETEDKSALKKHQILRLTHSDADTVLWLQCIKYLINENKSIEQTTPFFLSLTCVLLSLTYSWVLPLDFLFLRFSYPMWRTWISWLITSESCSTSQLRWPRRSSSLLSWVSGFLWGLQFSSTAQQHVKKMSCCLFRNIFLCTSLNQWAVHGMSQAWENLFDSWAIIVLKCSSESKKKTKQGFPVSTMLLIFTVIYQPTLWRARFLVLEKKEEAADFISTHRHNANLSNTQRHYCRSGSVNQVPEARYCCEILYILCENKTLTVVSAVKCWAGIFFFWTYNEPFFTILLTTRGVEGYSGTFGRHFYPKRRREQN